MNMYTLIINILKKVTYVVFMKKIKKIFLKYKLNFIMSTIFTGSK